LRDGKSSFVFFFAWFVVGRLASDSGGGERKKKKGPGARERCGVCDLDWNAGLGADWRFLFLYVRIGSF
jgi:hypothetical protein